MITRNARLEVVASSLGLGLLIRDKPDVNGVLGYVVWGVVILVPIDSNRCIHK